MEDKGGVQAVSLHRVFTLALGCMAVGWWAITPDRKMPEEALYTFWALLGITGGTKLVTAYKNGAEQ